ncbi:hypothetical protein EXIGLDRAFT_721630 [Exidia glandulosa HHB12029]|uniref:Uncharacterized protein n=1 Tax=Exidia glandulosa HHB12029 TaxID=1314781 RepID=A0A165FKJ9_EXIGL|nr:hypothetical protein EXIGLDRAFT_721630 [Exidia glandulosa HHB12029]
MRPPPGLPAPAACVVPLEVARSKKAWWRYHALASTEEHTIATAGYTSPSTTLGRRRASPVTGARAIASQRAHIACVP